MNPNGAAWREDGSLRVEALPAAKAEPSTASVIDELWQPLRGGLLSTRPEPRSWLLRHPTRNDVTVTDGQGDGLLPLGKVGLLPAAGGVGKTIVLMQLAVAIVTGRRFLDHFDIGDDARGGCVALVLGEEDAEEVHRRLWNVSEALRLTDTERRLVEQKLVVLPLTGRDCRLTEAGRDGSIVPTMDVDALLHRLEGGGWALVAIDPLSRFGGGDLDKNNSDATYFVQALERIAEASGATVLCSHHTSKASRREGGAESRGASALEDAARWVCTLRSDGDRVLLRQVKSNYSRPMPNDLALVREADGVLRAETAAERAAQEDDQGAAHEAALNADIERVVEALRKAGSAGSIDEIVALAAIKVTRGRTAVRLAVTRDRILKDGTARQPVFRVPGVCVQDPPYPPDVGTSSSLAPVVAGTSSSPASRTSRVVEGRQQDRLQSIPRPQVAGPVIGKADDDMPEKPGKPRRRVRRGKSTHWQGSQAGEPLCKSTAPTGSRVRITSDRDRVNCNECLLGLNGYRQLTSGEAAP